MAVGLHPLLVALALLQSPPATAPLEPRLSEIPWPAQLGIRAAAVELGVPTLRQVVLVPDVATWLDEIGRWTTEARWPVLLEDDRFAPLFVRGFRPERVLRRPSVGAPPEDRAALERAARTAIARAWGGRSAAEVTGIAPPGVALTSFDDPAWTAAVALAAGRGLPLAILDGAFGAPDDTLDATRFAELDAAVRDAVARVGLPYDQLGDAIDAVVLCRGVAAKARAAIDPAARMPLPPDAPVQPNDPFAVTDLLCRHSDGRRWAIAGWIFGSQERAAYMAMCSLFLPRQDAWFVNTYGSGEPWIRYAPDAAADALRSQGFTVRVSSGEQVSETNWLRLLMGGVSTDLLVMNSSGDPEWFSLFGNERGRTPDMPVLNRPTAIHLVHSWSMTRPNDPQTIGSRLLDQGAYAYYGSVQEPFLVAFVPPAALIQRCLAMAPFLVSARMLDGPMDRPWRLTAIGDPLLTVLPREQRDRRRFVELPPLESLPEGTRDLRSEATAAMRSFAASGDEAALASAFGALAILGEDDLAIGLYKVARGRGKTEAAASHVLGPYFRKREAEDFLEAFRLVERPTADHLDMLWHLLTPRIASLDEETLRLLRQHLRGPDTSVDLARLVVGFDRRFGRGASDRVVRDELERSPAPSPGIARRLGELLRR